MRRTSKKIKSAKKTGEGRWASWQVEYNEFSGTYYIHDTEYKLQLYVEKILQERTIMPKEIDHLLELHSDVVNHDRAMEDCD